MGGYYALAQHFGWALEHLFNKALHPRVIVLEDDIEIAADFFDYFSAVEPLLDADPTLLAASAWNDLGQPQFVDDPARVLRSDFFPGLGWMLTRRVRARARGPAERAVLRGPGGASERASSRRERAPRASSYSRTLLSLFSDSDAGMGRARA